jgi:uncharacterized protein (DUF58 family)
MVLVPTTRLAWLTLASASVLAVSPARSWWALVYVNLILIAAFVLDAVRAPEPSDIGVVRDFPDTVVLGSAVAVTWLVDNRRDRAVRTAMVDQLAPSLGARTRRFELTVPALTQVEIMTSLQPSRRGRFSLDEVTVRTWGPLGLGCRQRRRSIVDVVRVLPRFASRAEVARRLRQVRVFEAGARASRIRGRGTEFDQLRDYTPDDEFGRIDWQATARVGRPIVRQHRVEHHQTVVAMLDSGRVMAGNVAGVPRLEHAMDAVLALAAAAASFDDRAGLVAFDREVRAVVPPSAGRGQLSRLTEAMFDLEPVLVDSAYLWAFGQAVSRIPRRALFVVLTDLAGSVVETSLLPALPVLTRRHLVLVGAVQDADVVAWADGTNAAAAPEPLAHVSTGAGLDGMACDPSAQAAPSVEAARSANAVSDVSVEDAFRQAAAVLALDQRRTSAARLRAAGARVVDAPPGGLATELVDAYLDLRATGRL